MSQIRDGLSGSNPMTDGMGLDHQSYREASGFLGNEHILLTQQPVPLKSAVLVHESLPQSQT